MISKKFRNNKGIQNTESNKDHMIVCEDFENESELDSEVNNLKNKQSTK